jgi:hypothetical protein
MKSSTPFTYLSLAANLQTRFETWIIWNDVNGVRLFHFSYLITLMAYLYSQRTPNVQIKYFMFDWSIYRLFVLNTGWKRVFLQMMIFVNICSTCNMVELKARFETWMTRNDVMVWDFSPFLFNNSLDLPMLTVDTKCPNKVFYVWLVDLQIICVK